MAPRGFCREIVLFPSIFIVFSFLAALVIVLHPTPLKCCWLRSSSSPWAVPLLGLRRAQSNWDSTSDIPAPGSCSPVPPHPVPAHQVESEMALLGHSKGASKDTEQAAVGNGLSAFHSMGNPTLRGFTISFPIIPTIQVHEELLLSLTHRLIPKFICHKPINGDR